MHRFETIDLGPYRSDDYILTGFVEPEPTPGEPFDPATDADEYGVALARTMTYETNIEVVRMDTAHGQDPHMDLAYLPPDVGSDTQVELDDHCTYERMKQYLLTHWQDFADGYHYYNE